MPKQFINTERTNITYLTHLMKRTRDFEWAMSTRNRKNSTNYTLLCTKETLSPMEGGVSEAWKKARLSANDKFSGGSRCCIPEEDANVLQESEQSTISVEPPDGDKHGYQNANIGLRKNREQKPSERGASMAKTVDTGTWTDNSKGNPDQYLVR